MKALVLLWAIMSLAAAITASSCVLRGDFFGGQPWALDRDLESSEAATNIWGCDSDLLLNCEDGL